MGTIEVGLSSWIISDGNYPHFRAQREARFALEFYSEAGLKPGTSQDRFLSPATDQKAIYDVGGEIVYTSEESWVCDFGVFAFEEDEPPDWAETGRTGEGRIYLGVDPFFYFERLRKLPGMPRITYRVFVHQIFVETTPWIPDPEGRFAAIRDLTRISYREIAKTGAPSKDAGIAPEYVLVCEILESGVDHWRY